jgi:hypothetical protein
MQGVTTNGSHSNLTSLTHSPYLLQISAGLILILEVLLANDNGTHALLFSPIAIGSLFPLCWWFSKPISAVERWGPALHFRRDQAALESGGFATARRNTWAGAYAIWCLTGRLNPESLRAGVRVALLCYYFGAFAIFLAVLAYFAFVILVVILMLLAVVAALWFWLSNSSDKPRSPGSNTTPNDQRRTPPEPSSPINIEERDAAVVSRLLDVGHHRARFA